MQHMTASSLACCILQPRPLPAVSSESSPTSQHKPVSSVMMAEAFAIFSSIASVADVAGRTSLGLVDIIRAWQNAPAVLLALNNEVADLKVILGHLTTVYQVTGGNTTVHNHELMIAIGDHAKKAAEHLVSLDTLVTKLKAVPGSKQRLKFLSKKKQAERIKSD
ncbi:hypothetical protein BJ170DRAFT_388609 [Xylariales sp. AK1849]|nr:hypothetical protein BJ170DRAFT_388609 [Xylariales sp. AK1849]